MKKQLLSLGLFLVCIVCFAQEKARVTPQGKNVKVVEKLSHIRSIQKRLSDQQYKVEPVVCPANHSDVNTYVDFSAKVKAALANKQKLRGTQKTKKAQFVVTYQDFPEDAEASFQIAVDIWSELIESEVPINVVAIWEPLGPSVLGSASPAEFRVDFPGAPKRSTYYPISLAEKISRRELNAPGAADIVARFSADQNWYLSPAGNPAEGQFDLTTVALHELCHGLGFFSSFFAEGTEGSYGVFTNDDRPVVMDHYYENDRGQSLLDTSLFKTPSRELRNELISENLFFNGPLTVSQNSNQKPRMYAPTIFDSGSSISHLDDRDFPAGTINALMTPTSGQREVSRNPGPIVQSIFDDMGYSASALIHESFRDFEEVSSLDFSVQFFSDTTVGEKSVVLHMREINNAGASELDFEIPNIIQNAVEIPMTKEEGTNTYKVNYTFQSPNSYVVYWFTGVDDTGITVSSPAGAPGSNSFHVFTTGFSDIFGPRVFFFPGSFISTATPVPFSIFAEDDYDEDLTSVSVEYSIDGGPLQTVEIPKYDIARDDPELSRGDEIDEIFYYKEDVIPGLSVNQRVRYKIIVSDAAGNRIVVPTVAGGTLAADPVEEAEYELVATSFGQSVSEYYNDFEDPTDDFALLGFEIDQPEGLSSRALRTRSPYSNGLGLYNPSTYQVQGVNPQVLLDFEANQVALLRRPIVIKPDTAIISWDEIVLVEPGDDDSEFGDPDFWDFVVFEYSVDGNNWFNLEPGYDSRDDADWMQAFESSIGPSGAENYTSNATPLAALYRTREIDLYDFFAPQAAGATILIRFRLFSDQWANGSGWFIDNLAIQRPQEAALAIEENTGSFIIGPNPTTDVINIQLGNLVGDEAVLEVIDITGRKPISEKVKIVNNSLEHLLNVEKLAAGTYMLRVIDGQAVSKLKKFVVQ